MRAAANKEVDAVGGRVVSIDLEKTVPGSKGRIAEVRKIVCLMAGDHATRAGQSDHLGDYRFRVGHVYKHQARVNEIKDIARKPYCGGIPLKHFDVLQRSARRELSGCGDRLVVSFDTDHKSCRANALREKVQHSLRTASDIDRSATRAETYSVEQRIRFLTKLFRLLPEPSLFGFAVSQQVPRPPSPKVLIRCRSTHSVSPSMGVAQKRLQLDHRSPSEIDPFDKIRS